MTEYQSVVIVLIPRDGHKDEHCTLVWHHDTEVIGFMTQRAQMLANMFQPIESWVMGRAVFGRPDDRQVVATVQAPMLYIMRSYLELFSDSEWGFQPHITTVTGKPARTNFTKVVFDRIAVWSPDGRPTWRLGTGERCAEVANFS